MEALKRMAKRFKSLNVDKIMFKTMKANPILEKLALQLNQRQLKIGQTAKGKFLDDYSDASVEIYGKEPGPIQLHDTGDFYESMVVVLENDGFIIDADGIKVEDGVTTNLFIEYGQDITGLTEENLTIFINRLIPKIKQQIINHLLSNGV